MAINPFAEAYNAQMQQAMAGQQYGIGGMLGAYGWSEGARQIVPQREAEAEPDRNLLLLEDV